MIAFGATAAAVEVEAVCAVMLTRVVATAVRAATNVIKSSEAEARLFVWHERLGSVCQSPVSFVWRTALARSILPGD